MGSFEYKTKSNKLNISYPRSGARPIGGAVIAAMTGMAGVVSAAADHQATPHKWNFLQDIPGKYANLPMSDQKPTLCNHPLQRLGTGIPKLLKDGEIMDLLLENRGLKMPSRVRDAYEHEISNFSGLEVLDFLSIYSVHHKMTRTVLVLTKGVKLSLSFYDNDPKEFAFTLSRYSTTLAVGAADGKDIAKSLHEFLANI
ncbi:MAG: hypothetical protein K2M87_02055 [Muribaculaceae bacterium]|nr:hypothetical protein [Muribaculaceae bacterium]